MRIFRTAEPPAPEGGVGLDRNYRILRRMLAVNSDLLEQLADLESDLGFHDPDHPKVRAALRRLIDGLLLLIENLNALTAGAHERLYEVHREIEHAVQSALRSSLPLSEQPLLLPLNAADPSHSGEVGGKAASLGALRKAMPDLVPPGFVITTAGYRRFLRENAIEEPIHELHGKLSHVIGRELFGVRTAAIRSLIESSLVPEELVRAIADGAATAGGDGTRWAVRSSAAGEDGRHSFAGQYDSILDVPVGELPEAYRKVIASRFADRAVLYRLSQGFSEVATPMAVLFLPMLDARAAGVLYTRDPAGASSDRMLINSIAGRAQDLVRGTAEGDSFVGDRRSGAIIEQRVAGETAAAAGAGSDGESTAKASVSHEDVKTLIALGARIEEFFGAPQDIEWVLTPAGRPMIVQARPLRIEDVRRAAAGSPGVDDPPLIEGGITIVPGRGAGPVYRILRPEEIATAPEGAILVVSQATPELAAVLSSAAGLIAEHGNIAGHAATLLREFGVPSVFRLRGALDRLRPGAEVSLDAAHRRVYAGSLWKRSRASVPPGPRAAESPAGRLHERLFPLRLVDPLSSAFAARNCRSVHDVVRFVHEKAVAAIFDLGDRAVRRGPRRAWRIETGIPLQLRLLDLGGTLSAGLRDASAVRPEEIASVPFRALWEGISDPGVSWAGRQLRSASGFASVVVSQMVEGKAEERELGAPNYVIVGPEYLNLNARLAYHFAMVDALVSDAAENNYVNFRFRGGGAGAARRELRADFLAEVLSRSGFAVRRRGDLVTAWLRHHSRQASEDGLSLIGRLMACARQLDMLMDDPGKTAWFVDRFLGGDYRVFA